MAAAPLPKCAIVGSYVRYASKTNEDIWSSLHNIDLEEPSLEITISSDNITEFSHAVLKSLNWDPSTMGCFLSMTHGESTVTSSSISASLGLQGPSLDTTSPGTALHFAIRSVIMGDCSMALVISASSSVLSVLIVQLLSSATRDSHSVHAIIHGTSLASMHASDKLEAHFVAACSRTAMDPNHVALSCASAPEDSRSALVRGASAVFPALRSGAALSLALGPLLIPRFLLMAARNTLLTADGLSPMDGGRALSATFLDNGSLSTVLLEAPAPIAPASDAPAPLTTDTEEAQAETPAPEATTLSGETGAVGMSHNPLSDIEHLLPPLDHLGSLPAASFPPRAVLLTGVTGFLGRFMLHEFLTQTTAQAHCLVRARTPDAAMKRIRDALTDAMLWDDAYTDRIVPVCGDLARPRLGLSGDVFDALARGVDAIFHCGASVRLIAVYEAVRPANVISVVECIRLCSTYTAKPLHFVGTLGIFPEYQYSFVPPYNRRRYETDTIGHAELAQADPTDGYPVSKFVAETLVRNAGEHGLPVAVYRAGSIAAAVSTGYSNHQDLVTLMWRACALVGAVPENSDVREISPVDIIARALVRLALKPPGTRQHMVYHMTTPEPFTSILSQQLLRDVGFPHMRLVSQTHWERLLDAHKHLSPAVGRAVHWFVAGRDSKAQKVTRGYIDSRNLMADLPDMFWPPAREVVIKQLKWMSARGMMEAGPGVVTDDALADHSPADDEPEMPTPPEPTGPARNSGDAKALSTELRASLVELRERLRPQEAPRMIALAKLRELMQSYVTRHLASKAITGHYRAVHAEPLARWRKHVRTQDKEMAFPVAATRAEGAFLWDADGNKTLDFCMGSGTAFLGHRAPVITDAVRTLLDKGYALGPQSDLAGEVATLICEMTGMERVAFCNSGSEAISVALRAARASTCRPTVLVTRHGTHGWLDTNIVPAADTRAEWVGTLGTHGMRAIEYGAEGVFELLGEHHAEIAAILIEPVPLAAPVANPEWLTRLREATRRHGVLLIFDEIFTGFRCHPGGAQALFDVGADIVCYGKALGGGFPIGAVSCVGGLLDVCDGGSDWRFGDDSLPRAEMTFVAGTYCKHPLSMVAARAFLTYLNAHSEICAETTRRATAAAAELTRFFRDANASHVHVQHFGPLIALASEQPLYFLDLLRLKGISLGGKARIVLSAAHTDEHVDYLVAACKAAYTELHTPQRITAGIPAWIAAGHDATEAMAYVAAKDIQALDHNGRAVSAAMGRALWKKKEREIKQNTGKHAQAAPLDYAGVDLPARLADPRPAAHSPPQLPDEFDNSALLTKLRREYGSYMVIVREALLMGTCDPEKARELAAALGERYQTSKSLAQHFRRPLCDYRYVWGSLGVTEESKELQFPIVATRGEGGLITDADGHRLIDFNMGFGAVFHGHNHALVREAVAQLLDRGFAVGEHNHLAGEVAQLVSELTGMQRACFTNSGSEAVALAVRLVRAASGKPVVLIGRNCYHGWLDTLIQPQVDSPKENWMPGAPGVLSVHGIEAVPFGGDELFEILKTRSHEIAAVLLEPIPGSTCAYHPEWLRRVRRETELRDVFLVLDEVYTGFRFNVGGAQAELGIRADLATYGKILGNGFPIGCVAGRPEIMDLVDGGAWKYGDESLPGPATFFAGTFCEHPLAMVAARETLEDFKKRGNELHRHNNERVHRVAEELRRYFEAESMPITVVDYKSWMTVVPAEGVRDCLPEALLLKGISVPAHRRVIITPAHTDAMIDYFCEAAKQAMRELYTPTLSFAPTIPDWLRPADAEAEAQDGRDLVRRNGVALLPPPSY